MAEAVLLAVPLKALFRKIQGVMDGTIAPEVAFPDVPKPPPPDEIEPDPPRREKCAPTREERAVRARRRGAPDPRGRRQLDKPPSKRRVCVDCGKRRKITQFYVNAKSRGGVAIRCRKCWQVRAKANRMKHPNAKEWARRANERYEVTEAAAFRNERYRASYKGLISERMAAHKRRSRNEGVEHDLTKEDMKAILKEFFGRCAYCNEPCSEFRFDHVIPVQDGGPDVPANQVPACRQCNRKKGKKNIYVLMHDTWDPKMKARYQRVLAHAWRGRRNELIRPKLERYELEAGPPDPEMARMEPWMRLLVRRGTMPKTEAMAALDLLGEEGLLALQEQYRDNLEYAAREDRDEGER